MSVFEERITDSNIRLRFVAELRSHEERVRTLVHAAMSPALQCRALSLELLGLTGEAAVLGVSEAKDLAGALGEMLATCDTDLGPAFWGAFELWFSRLCEHLCALLGNRRSTVTNSDLIQERARLEVRVRRASAVTVNTPSLSVAAGRRVLFIDDSPTTRAVVLATLADCGYTARVASDLKETAVMLLDFEPELVVADVQLPGIDGDELCRRIKQTTHRVVPVVLYSSLPDAELAARAKAAGADAFVGKHHGVADLLRCIDSMFAEAVLF